MQNGTDNDKDKDDINLLKNFDTISSSDAYLTSKNNHHNDTINVEEKAEGHKNNHRKTDLTNSLTH